MRNVICGNRAPRNIKIADVPGGDTAIGNTVGFLNITGDPGMNSVRRMHINPPDSAGDLILKAARTDDIVLRKHIVAERKVDVRQLQEKIRRMKYRFFS